MSNSVEVVERIKEQCRKKGITVLQLLSSCDLSKNTFHNMNKSGNLPRSESIIKIAEQLDCSIDFLLTGKERNSGVTELTRCDFIANTNEQKMLELFRQLPQDDQLIFIGRLMERVEAAKAEEAGAVRAV